MKKRVQSRLHLPIGQALSELAFLAQDVLCLLKGFGWRSGNPAHIFLSSPLISADVIHDFENISKLPVRKTDSDIDCSALMRESR